MDEDRLAELWKTLHRDEKAPPCVDQTSRSWLRAEFGGVITLLEGYFHQDWGLQLESADDVLAAAVGNASKEELQIAIEQLPRLIELVGHARHQIELTSLFLALGINYRPEADGLTTKEWFQQVHHCMVRELAARP